MSKKLIVFISIIIILLSFSFGLYVYEYKKENSKTTNCISVPNPYFEDSYC